MNILVIGGSGLFGRKIVAHLLRDSDVDTVVSMDVNPPPDWFREAIKDDSGGFRYVRGDVSRLEDILDTIRRSDIDRMVNMAFILTGAFEANPRLAVRVDTLGMCNFFEAARLMKIKRVVYASSVAVYGAQGEYGDREVNEDDVPHPASAYGLTKQLAEIVAGRYAELYGLSPTGIRPFLGYGHGGAFPPIIKEFSDLVSLPAVGKPFTTEADGMARTSLSSADDVAALVRLLVKRDSTPHPVYNVGGPPTSMRDLAAAIRRYLPDARIDFGGQSPPPEAAGAGLPWRVSMALAREDLGYALMPLEEAVLRHVNDARRAAGLAPVEAGGAL
jgi:nucleoside-diphosphate-sugar epimerase